MGVFDNIGGALKGVVGQVVAAEAPALLAGKPLVVAGGLNATMAFLTRFAPRQFAASMARRMQE